MSPSELPIRYGTVWLHADYKHQRLRNARGNALRVLQNQLMCTVETKNP
jgi:hypothetical protein